VPDVLPILGTSCETFAMLRDTPADGRRDRVQEALVAWVVAECRQAPRLVLLEDVHWLDPSSEDLCRRLATVARELPLLLLMTSRLPLAGSRLEVAGVREIRLRSLASDDIAALVDAQLDPYPARERLRRAVAERAQGNPFYAEELVRAFRERGDLVLADGAYDLTADAAAVVPPTLHALIAARIDRLSPPRAT
jgi:predicted ATPase